MLEQERFALGGDRRVDDRFEPGELLGVTKDERSQSFARNTGFVGAPRKGRFDFGDQPSPRALECAHFGICVEDGHTCCLEHGGHGGFSHSDRSGEANYERSGHARSLSRSSASFSRGGSAPKKWVKAAAAWPISIA